MVAGAAETKGQQAQGLEEVLGGATADLLSLGLGARLHPKAQLSPREGVPGSPALPTWEPRGPPWARAKPVRTVSPAARAAAAGTSAGWVGDWWTLGSAHRALRLHVLGRRPSTCRPVRLLPRFRFLGAPSESHSTWW